MTLGDIGVAAPPDSTGGPDLVQLLTPEGERVQHPDYPLDITAEEIRASTATSCWSAASTSRRPRCSGRASWASGPRCSARRPRRSAPAARCGPGDMAFPSYREHGVAWCRGVRPGPTLLGLYRGTDLGGWDPQRPQLQPLLDRHRRPDPARDRLRHGRPARRRRGRRDRLLRRRRVQPGRRQRGVRVGERLQRPGRLLLPEQPVGDLRADREAVPDPALPAGAAASASRASGSTATTCSPASRSPGRRSTRPGPARARRSSRRTPTGWARTPRPTTRPATGWPASWRCGGCGTRSSGSRPTCPAPDRPTRTSSTSIEAEADELGRARAAGLPGAARPGAARRSSTRCTSSRRRSCERQRAGFAAYLDSFEEAEH